MTKFIADFIFCTSSLSYDGANEVNGMSGANRYCWTSPTQVSQPEACPVRNNPYPVARMT